jgi:hypothetical protein
MRRIVRLVLLAVLTVTMCWGASLLFPAQAQAKTVTALEGAKFDTGASLADNLRIYLGKDVFIHLRSGKTLQGYVKSVGNGLVHLEKLAGRDFYDALVRIEDISAIEAKFRNMK